MKRKQDPQKRKHIREVKTHKNYNGEASPYWDFMGSHQWSADEGDVVEDTLANPDVLSDENVLHTRPLSDAGEIQLTAVQEVLPLLSPRQQEALRLCGYLGYTLEAGALSMNISIRALRTLLNRARKAIQRRYRTLVGQS